LAETEGLARLRSIVDLELCEDSLFENGGEEDIYKEEIDQEYPDLYDDGNQQASNETNPRFEVQAGRESIVDEIKEAMSHDIDDGVEGDEIEGETVISLVEQSVENLDQRMRANIEKFHLDKSLSSSPCSGIDKLEILNEKLAQLESEISLLKIELAEERIQRQQLGEIIPHLMRNQDEVLGLLHSLNRS